MSKLDEIIAHKCMEVETAKNTVSLDMLQDQITRLNPPRRLVQTDKLQLIAEVKRKSPSMGTIRQDFDPLWLAQTFEAHGAAAISVLTDEAYFGGSLDILRQIRKHSSLPLLRKDFIVDLYQVYETKAAGADIVLLIVKVVGKALPELMAAASMLDLQVLVEVHDSAELQEAIRALPNYPNALIGINNRNLENFTIDTGTSLRLAHSIPSQIFKVAESGINSTNQLQEMAKAGFDAVLIGSGLAANPKLLNYFKHEQTPN